MKFQKKRTRNKPSSVESSFNINVITDVMPTAYEFAEYDKRLHGPASSINADADREEGEEEEHSDAESVGSGSSYEMPPGMSVSMDAMGRAIAPPDDY